MLQSMRERTQGIIAGTVVALVCITFALWGVQYYTHGSGATNVVAKVDGVKITEEELRINVERARQQMGPKIAFDQVALAKLKQDVLQRLIKRHVYAEATRRLGFSINNQQLEALVKHMPIFQKNGHFSFERFQEILERMFYSENGFLEETSNALLTDQLAVGISNSSFLLPNEVSDAFRLFNQTRDIKYALLSADYFARKVKISETSILSYYQSHQQEFMLPESVSVSYLQLTSEDLVSQLPALTIEQLKKQYNDNIDLYSQPKRWQVEKISYKIPRNAKPNEIEEIKNKLETFHKNAATGTSFLELSPEHSESSAWLKPNETNPELIAELNKLKPGQITNTVLIGNRYGIFRLIEIEKAKPLPFSQVRTQIEKALTQQRLLKLFSEKNDKLSELTYTNSDSLKPAALALNLPIQNTKIFTREGGKEVLTTNPKFIKIAFSDLVLLQGYNSNPIEIQPGNIVVMRIKEHNLAKVRSLAEVRAEILQKLEIAEIKKMSQDLGKEILALWQKDTSIHELTNKYHLVWRKISGLKRNDSRILPEVIDAAFQGRLGNASSKLPITGAPLNKGGYVFLEITKITDGDIDKVTAKQSLDFQDKLEAEFKDYEYSTFFAGFMRHAKIKILDNNKTVNNKIDLNDLP